MKQRIYFPFVGDTIGGSHRSSLLLIKELKHRNIDAVIVVHEAGVLHDKLLHGNIEVLKLPIEIRPRKSRLLTIIEIVLSIRRICSFICYNKISLVHTNDARIQLLWAIPCWICRVPMVWHQRTIFSDSKILRLFSNQFATTIVSISHAVHNSLTAKSQQISRIVYNPISLKSASYNLVESKRNYILEQASTTQANSFIIGYFGNLRFVKRPMVFIEAANLLSRLTDPIVIFCVFGEDRESFIPRMKSHASDRGFIDRLFFFGFQSEIEPWIAACDLTISTSVGEGFGRILPESMALGTPVLATNSGGHVEIVTHNVNGMLATPEDPAAIANMVVAYITDDQLRDSIIAEGLKYVKQYDVVHHADQIMLVYKQILN